MAIHILQLIIRHKIQIIIITMLFYIEFSLLIGVCLQYINVL